MANIEIGGRLHSTATGNVVTGANEVLDDTKNKKQSVINAEVDETIGDDNTAGTIKGRIKTAEGKLDTLNGDSSTSGSVAKAVADAKTELIDGATSNGNTLKKVEDRTATLETAVGSNGSVDQRIAAAKSKVIGDAASDYNTLGKLEDKIQAEASARESAVSTEAQARQDAITAETNRATTRENQIYDLVHTPEQHYVTVPTYADLANIASPSDDTIYKVSSYNGKTSQVDNTVYSEYGYDGTNFVFLCVKSQIDEVYDISAHHSNNTYVDLAAALDGGNNIPQELRRGGMSVKFVQSSDNNYVQFRCMTQSFTTDATQWQEMVSKDYVKAEYGTENSDLDLNDNNGNILARFSNGHIKTKNFDSSHIVANDIDDNIVSTSKIQDSAITNSKIQDGTIEDSKLKSEHPISDSGSKCDLDICDKNGNIIARYHDGIHDTKFPSPYTCNDINTELDIEDPNGFKVLRIKNGHIKTEKFDSSDVLESLTDATQSSRGLMSAADKTKLDSLTTFVATTSAKGYMSAADKYKMDNIQNTWQSYGEATPSAAGLMSASDKTKLDNIVVQTPIISGSGMYKNAAAYGFLPTADGATNSNALQSAVNGGGTIVVDIPGTYDICYTCKLPSNTTLIFGNGVVLNKVKDSNNDYGCYVFINEGAYNKVYNENITIIGMNILINGIGAPYNVADTHVKDTLFIAPKIRARSQFMFVYTKRVRILHCKIYDSYETFSPLTDYSHNFGFHHFYDVVAEDITIYSPHDGLDFTNGEKVVLRHLDLCTNDDPIGFHTVGYPDATISVGPVSDILIEDVKLRQDEHWYNGLQIRFNVGAWTDWESGKKYSQWGDICVSNGRIYRTTTGSQRADPVVMIESTYQPTHTSGEVTYADGLTWSMLQDTEICYSPTIKNVYLRNIHIIHTRSTFTDGIWFTTDHNTYSYQIHEDAAIPIISNIHLNNVYGTNIHLFDAEIPFKNVVISNCRWTQPIRINKQGGIDWMSLSEHNSTVVVTNCIFDDETISNKIINSTTEGNITLMCKNNFVFNENPLTVTGDNIEFITD